MQFKFFSISDKGKIRNRNEDSFLELNLKNSGNDTLLLVVADGMGGHNAGEVASKTVVSSIENYFKSEKSYSENNIINSLKESIEIANKEVLKASSENESLKGMGSTCTALFLKNNQTFIAHVGDSRAFLIREKSIKQLTKDHTVAEQMFENGMITEEELKTSPQRNMLTKAIGVSSDIEVETYGPFNINSGDCFLLCSDGLTEHVDEDEICSITNTYGPEEACNLLVKIANKRGGSDNITAQIVKIT